MLLDSTALLCNLSVLLSLLGDIDCVAVSLATNHAQSICHTCLGGWVMASQAISPSSHRHKPNPVEIPDTVATEAEEGQAGANSLLAAQASDKLAARRSEVNM